MAARRANISSGTDLPTSMRLRLPCQTMPTLKPLRRQCRWRHCATRRGSRAQVGHRGGNVRQRGAEGERQAHQRTVIVAPARACSPGATMRIVGLRPRQQLAQLRLHGEHHPRAALLGEFRVAAELNRVTERLVGIDEQRPAGNVRPHRARPVREAAGAAAGWSSLRHSYSGSPCAKSPDEQQAHALVEIVPARAAVQSDRPLIARAWPPGSAADRTGRCRGYSGYAASGSLAQRQLILRQRLLRLARDPAARCRGCRAPRACPAASSAHGGSWRAPRPAWPSSHCSRAEVVVGLGEIRLQREGALVTARRLADSLRGPGAPVRGCYRPRQKLGCRAMARS